MKVMHGESVRNLRGFTTHLCISLSAAKTPHEQTALQRQIAATDQQIDALVYALYGLIPDEIALVEQATAKPESAKEKPE